MITPKLKPTKVNSLYPYYAGYSYDFVLETLKNHTRESYHVLDPWSGTGLTSVASKELGLASVGIDINPVMTVIAKANNIHRELHSSILSLSSEIISKFSQHNDLAIINIENDPLNLWFDLDTTRLLRFLDNIIYNLLVNAEPRLTVVIDESQLNSLSSFFYVVLFHLTKQSVKQKFSTSNPTWIKVPKLDEPKIELTKVNIISQFKNIVDTQLVLINTLPYFNTPNQDTSFLTANSTNMPLFDNTIDYILTSPPYCTRIDYAVAMRPEMAVLGLGDNRQFKHLRKTMTGSPTIRANKVSPDISWGNACNHFLDQVYNHASIASNTYYHTNLLQYFYDIYQSFKEIYRVSKPNSELSIVVQDSFYKDIHNDLPTYFTQMLTSLGFHQTQSTAFKSNSFDNINTKSSAYKKGKKTQEFLLTFKNTGK